MSLLSNSAKRLETRLREREDEYISYKQFTILIGTFNVNNRTAPNNILLEDWFEQVSRQDKQQDRIIPDLIAVGFQEIDTSSGAYIYDDKRKEDEWEQIVKKTIQICYDSTNKNDDRQFELLNRVRLMGKKSNIG
jgi:hypothetical protein